MTVCLSVVCLSEQCCLVTCNTRWQNQTTMDCRMRSPSRRRQSYSSSPITRDREQRKQQNTRVQRQQDEHRNRASHNMLGSSTGGQKRGTGRSRSQPPPQQRAIASRPRRKTKKLQKGNTFREKGSSDVAARPSSSGRGAAHRRSRSLGGAGSGGPTTSRPFETRVRTTEQK